MSVPGIRFTAPPAPLSGPGNRADIALFAGLIGRTGVALPTTQRETLVRQGWVGSAALMAGETAEKAVTRLKKESALLGIPVAVESWTAFEELYAVNSKPVEAGAPDRIACPMGLAVHSFFAEGGRQAYILRTGDPYPLVDLGDTTATFRARKRKLLDWNAADAPADAADRVPLLPGFINFANQPDPGTRASWLGMAAIFGIEDAAILLLPDLIELCAGAPLPVAAIPQPLGPEEQFKDCAVALPAAIPPTRPGRPQWHAPRLDKDGYSTWARAIRHALDMLGRPTGPGHRRDVMLVGAAPLPSAESGYDKGEERNPLQVLERDSAAIDKQSLLDSSLAGSARLQLVYPWITTGQSLGQPETIQSPEGMMAGMMARTAMLHGAFHSCAGQQPNSVNAVMPELTSAELANGSNGSADGWLGDRLSLIGRRYGEITLLSDATTSGSKAWQVGGVSRLMGIILRGARTLGQDLMFEPSGPQVWAQMEDMFRNFLEGLRQRRAFEGMTAADCYEVRCDRTTMTQYDIDNGRTIARVSFSPAYPVERITVSLAMTEPATTQQQRAA
jgi:uncharacterized protein